MSLIPRIAALEMFRVAEQHRQSTESSHRRTNEMVAEQHNDITDQFIDLCEKHQALKKRSEMKVSVLIALVRSMCNKSDALTAVLDHLYLPAASSPNGTLSREAVQDMVNERLAVLDNDADIRARRTKQIESYLSRQEAKQIATNKR